MILNPFTFQKSTQFLEDNDYPELAVLNKIGLVKNVEESIKTGNIYFDEHTNGCMFKDKFGDTYNGYLFKYKYFLQRYDMKMPSKHILECKTIKEMKRDNKYHHYHLATDKKVDVLDIDTHIISKENELKVCGNCINEMSAVIDKLRLKYKDELVKQENPNDVDAYGYCLNWQTLSRIYKQEQNYTCENCGISPKWLNGKGRFIHVHHEDWDKSNNHESNLKCLCVLCHFNKDGMHRRRMRDFDDLHLFVRNYESIIRKHFKKALPGLEAYKNY